MSHRRGHGIKGPARSDFPEGTGAFCVLLNPRSKKNKDHTEALAYILWFAYDRSTPCFHCRTMTLPDTNDPQFFSASPDAAVSPNIPAPKPAPGGLAHSRRPAAPSCAGGAFDLMAQWPDDRCCCGRNGPVPIFSGFVWPLGPPFAMFADVPGLKNVFSCGACVYSGGGRGGPIRGRPAVRGKRTSGGRPGQRVEEQGTRASRTQKHSEAGYGRPVDGGAWAAEPVKRPRQQPAQSSIRQLLGAADAHTAHPATSSTAPAHQLLGSANTETTPAGAPAAAADRTQRPDATCEGTNG